MTEQRLKLIETAKSASREWTELELSEGNDPTLDDFLEVFPLYNTPYLREIVGVEMFNVKHRNELLRVGQKVQGA